MADGGTKCREEVDSCLLLLVPLKEITRLAASPVERRLLAQVPELERGLGQASQWVAVSARACDMKRRRGSCRWSWNG